LMNLLKMPQRKVFILWMKWTCISTDSVGGLIALYAVPMLNADLMDIQEENRHQLKPMMMAVKVLQIRLFQWSLQTILNYNVQCDLNAERCLQVRRAIDRDTACYRILYREKNFLLTSYSRKVMRYSQQVLLVSIKIGYFSGLIL
jgi:hypothetical protein